MKRFTVGKIKASKYFTRKTYEKYTDEEKQFKAEINDELYDIYKKSNVKGGRATKVRKLEYSANLCSAPFYEFLEVKYRTRKNRPFRREKRVIVNKIFEVIVDELINRDGGVVLDKLGYLAVWVTPKKVRLTNFDTFKYTKFMTETNGYFYNISLFTDIFKTGLNTLAWTMDRAIIKPIKRAVFQNVAAGKKYKLYYRTVKSMHSKQYSNTLMSEGFS